MGGTFSVKFVTARAALEITGFGDVDRAPWATLDQMTG